MGEIQPDRSRRSDSFIPSAKSKKSRKSTDKTSELSKLLSSDPTRSSKGTGVHEPKKSLERPPVDHSKLPGIQNPTNIKEQSSFLVSKEKLKTTGLRKKLIGSKRKEAILKKEKSLFKEYDPQLEEKNTPNKKKLNHSFIRIDGLKIKDLQEAPASFENIMNFNIDILKDGAMGNGKILGNYFDLFLTCKASSNISLPKVPVTTILRSPSKSLVDLKDSKKTKEKFLNLKKEFDKRKTILKGSIPLQKVQHLVKNGWDVVLVKDRFILKKKVKDLSDLHTISFKDEKITPTPVDNTYLEIEIPISPEELKVFASSDS